MSLARELIWETAAVAGSVILIHNVDPELPRSRPSIRVTHWTAVIVYSLISITGFRIGLWFALKHGTFVEAFSQPNVLGASAWAMQALALIFALLAIPFYFVVMRLGKLRRWARLPFVCMVIPCGVLYPIVGATATGIVSQVEIAPKLTWIASTILFAAGCASIGFYSSPSVLVLLGLTQRANCVDANLPSIAKGS